MEIHGKKKIPTWSFLNTTIIPGATTLMLTEQVNWEVGDRIVIASTDFDHRHSEEATITAIRNYSSTNGSVLEFYPPVKFSHYGAS